MLEHLGVAGTIVRLALVCSTLAYHLQFVHRWKLRLSLQETLILLADKAPIRTPL